MKSFMTTLTQILATSFLVGSSILQANDSGTTVPEYFKIPLNEIVA